MTEPPTRELFEGTAIGGPLSGQIIHSRFPRGVVVVDRVNNKAWVYHRKDRLFLKDLYILDPDDDGNHERTCDHEKRWTAAEESHYDVLAVTT